MMGRIRTVLIGLACGTIAFCVVATGTYLTLWHYTAMDKVTADDNPGVVLGAFWCIGSSIVAGVLAAVVTVTITFLRSS